MSLKSLSIIASLLMITSCAASVKISPSGETDVATFAGGCFWCTEAAFEKVSGVTGVVSGYANGQTKNPTYDDYAEGGHVEVVQIRYNPSLVSYKELLDVFWQNINTTD